MHLLSSAEAAGPGSAADVRSTSVTGTGVSSVTSLKVAMSTPGTERFLVGKTKADTFDSVRIKVAAASVTRTGGSLVDSVKRQFQPPKAPTPQQLLLETEHLHFGSSSVSVSSLVRYTIAH